MVSVIVPAHNEASVIGRCLEALTSGPEAADLEVIVVCNGCSDATAQVARGYGDTVKVIEVEKPSKANALNVGDAAASHFPRLYADADVVLTAAAAKAVADVLAQDGVLAASPGVRIVFPPGTSPLVRGYYAVWLNLPYVKDGMVTAGVYGLSAAGRARFGDFPMLISDDGYVRSLFTAEERVEVRGVESVVSMPGKFADLIKIRTRGRLGMYELREKFPDRFANATNAGRYGEAVRMILTRPRLWFAAVPYFWVTLVSLWRARRQARNLQHYVWERDQSSRDMPDLPAPDLSIRA